MPRATWTQHNFNGGEWSPLAYGRSDIDKYKNALATCLNYVPTAQGGLTRRPGTYYVANTKSNAQVRLVPFEYSITQAYVLEFGAGYIRFYTNQGQLPNTGVPYEIVSPYGVADLADLAFTQSADTLYIAHPNYKPRKLQRSGSLSWALNTISFSDGPYLTVNATATTITLSGTSGAVTATASATTGINGGAGFSSNDVGRSIRFKSGANWGWGTITGYTSSTVVTVTLTTSPSAATASTFWRLGVWYGVEGSSSTASYPRAVTFHQDRLWLAGSASYPNRLDASNTSDYENFAPADNTGLVVDSNAMGFSLNAQKVNTINWLMSDEWGLLAGTASGEYVIAASTTQNAITPTNVNAKMTTSYGGTNVLPVRMGKSTLFVQRSGRKLREMSYQFTIGSFQAPDISLVSEHLTTTQIKAMAAALQPQPVLWMVRGDGTLIGMSYDKDQSVIAWHQHQLGGASDANGSAPDVESIAVIPTPEVDRDELWMSVKRYVNGATVRTVERLTKFWEDGDTLTNAFFVDCGAVYSGASTTTVSGLTWLIGQTVKVLANGAVHPDCVVDGTGKITLSYAATNVSVGLGYNSDGKTMRIESGGADGSAQGKLKRIHRSIFRFFQSVGMIVQGSGSPAAYPEPWRTSADKMDNPVALYTGDKRWAWEGTYEVEGQIFWRQSDPLPSNVLMVVAQLETQDGG